MFSQFNPYTGKLLANIAFTELSAIQSSITTLKTVGKTAQANLAPYQRADILRRVADVLKNNKEELAKLITVETGKVILESRGEVDRACNTFISCSEEARKVGGGMIQSADTFGPTKDKHIYIFSNPLGLVFCVAPFNFPINLLAHKIGPGFAAGNTLLVKPHPQTYATTKKVVELCIEAGFPKETIALAMPTNENVLKIAEDDMVDCVNLTGSVAAGKIIGRAAGYKKLLFELGGNDAMILMKDGNVDMAVSQALERFGFAGQKCIAPKRIYIHSSKYTEFRDKIVAKTKLLNVGDPMKVETQCGPVISSASADCVWERLQSAIAAGAKVLTGNIREGNVIHPTVIEMVPDEHILVAEETFGPVLPIRSFETTEELLKLVNSSPYGLQAGVFTDSLDTAKKLFKEVDVGLLGVNAGPLFRTETMPFGGVKKSGIGREGVAFAIQEMQHFKSLIM